MELLNEAITLDPQFALAWAYKAYIQILINFYGVSNNSTIIELGAAQRTAEKAIELESDKNANFVCPDEHDRMLNNKYYR